MCLPQNNTYSPFFGAVVGRVANRITNATFVLDNVTYHIPPNDGPKNQNALHGGLNGWSTKVWNLTRVDSDLGDAVRLTYTSPDGDNVRLTASDVCPPLSQPCPLLPTFV